MCNITAKDLKPCPFCGKQPSIVIYYADNKRGDRFDAACYTPGCFLEYGADWRLISLEELLLMWNNRN